MTIINKSTTRAGASAQQQSSGVVVPTRGPLSQTCLGTCCRSEASSSCLKATPTDGSGPTFSDEKILAKSRAATNRLLPQEAAMSSHQHIISHCLLATGNIMDERRNGFHQLPTQALMNAGQSLQPLNQAIQRRFQTAPQREIASI